MIEGGCLSMLNKVANNLAVRIWFSGGTQIQTVYLQSGHTVVS